MSSNIHTLIAILLMALGGIGLPISILPIFYEVNPVQKIRVSTRQMVFMLMWLMLLGIGIANLYFVLAGSNKDPEGSGSSTQSGTPQESDDSSGEDLANQDGKDDGKDDSDGDDIGLSPEKLIVKQNSDLIQQLKAEYSDEDLEVIKSESSSVYIRIYEKAGCIFQNLLKAGECYVFDGKPVSSARVIILDYFSDEIICALTSDESGEVRHSPGNQNKFYCVVFHDNYNIYVTPPIQVVSGENNGSFSIYLEEEDSEYTPLCQFRIHVQDPSADTPYSIASPEDRINFYCETVMPDETIVCGGYGSSVNELGILSWGNKTYFSLNTKYTMDIYLRRGIDLQSTHNKISSFPENSNIMDLYFVLKDSSENAE